MEKRCTGHGSYSQGGRISFGLGGLAGARDLWRDIPAEELSAQNRLNFLYASEEGMGCPGGDELLVNRSIQAQPYWSFGLRLLEKDPRG